LPSIAERLDILDRAPVPVAPPPLLDRLDRLSAGAPAAAGSGIIDAAVTAAKARPGILERLDLVKQAPPSPAPAHLRRSRRGSDPAQPVAPPVAPDTAVGLGGSGRPVSFAAAAVQGGADVLAGIPKSIAIAQSRDSAVMQGLFDRLDAGEKVSPGDAPSLEAASALALYRALPKQREALRGRFAVVDPRESGLYQAGEALSSAVREIAPTNPRYEGEFGQKLASGIGSTAGFAIAGLLTRGAGMSGAMGAALTGAATGAVSQFEDALAKGAPLEAAYRASGLGAVVGTSEAVPITRILDRLDRSSGGNLRRVLVEGLKGGAEEGFQELFQQVSQNLIASDLVAYDPERQTFQGTGEAAGVGFTVGGLFSVLASMVGLRSRQAPAEPLAPRGEAGAPPAPIPAAPAPEATTAPPQRAEPTIAPPGPLQPPGAPVAAPPVAPPAPTPPVAPPAAAQPPNVVVTPRGRQVEVRPEVVDAAALVTSHGADLEVNPAFPADLQPRERGRAASQAQIAQIAGNPEPALLGLTGSASDGAPIVGPDNVVESGNARTLALARAYQQGTAGDYRRFIEQQGYDTTGMTAPVLIRRRVSELSPEDRAAFTREANERTTLAMGAAEQARADAQSMPPDLLAGYRGGDLNSAANRPFIRQVVKATVPASEHGAVFTAGGTLSQAGLQRIENALFARAYDDSGLLEGLREAADSNIKAIGGAMLEAAPRWAQMRSRVQEGLTPAELDITDALTEAARLISEARRQGMLVSDLVEQGQLFGAAPSQTTRAVLDLLFRDDAWKRPRDAGKIAQALDYYAAQAARAQAGPSLLNEPAPGPVELLRLARQSGQGSLEPGTGPTPAAALAPAERMVRTPAGQAKAIFPDQLHAQLYDLAAKPSREGARRAEARRIYVQLEGYVLDDPQGARFRGPADVIKLARDYRDDVHDSMEANIRYRGGKPEYQGFVVDPERQTRYLMRSRLGKTEEEMGETAYSRQPGGIVERLDGLERARETLPRTAAAAKTGGTGPGKNYVGLIVDQLDGTVPDKPIRREDILRPLVKALGVPLYQGRIKSNKMLGFYRKKLQEVRIKRMADVEVAAHEFAHFMDDIYPEIRKTWWPATPKNERIREELRGVSYDESKIFEGFAEFVRLWATRSQDAKQKAPNFYDWFEGFLDRNEHGQAWRDAQRGMHDWFAQSALSRASSKIGQAKEINVGLVTIWDWFRQGVFDDLHGIMRMERGLTGVLAPVGAYVSARLTRAKHSFIEGTLLYGAPVIRPDGSHAFEGKGLIEILEPVQERLEDFLRYAVGRSAQELLNQGREKRFTRTEVKAMLALETAEFKQAFEDYQTWNTAILDFAQAKGVINPDKRATWGRSQYVPFWRVSHPKPGAFSRTPGDWHGIRRLTGGTGNLRDILQNMIGNASMLIDAALTNEARLKVAKLARGKAGARFMARIPKESRRAIVLTNSVRAAAKDAYAESLAAAEKAAIAKGDESPLDIGERSKAAQDTFDDLADELFDAMPGALAALTTPQAPQGKNVVAVLRGGEAEYYEVADPLLYRALTRLHRPARHWLVKALAVPKRVSQASVTLSFDFLTANVARDTLMGWVMSKHGFKPMVDSARGMASRIRSDPNYREFIANGGGLSSYLVDENAFRSHLERFYRKKGIDYQTVIDSPRKLLLAFERLADAFEMSTRLGEFYRAKQAGEHPRQAAYAAREVSTDFAMRGDWAAVELAYDSIIFLKAAMNGLDRLYRGVAHDENRGAIAAKTGAIALISIGLVLVNHGNPLYDDLEDWEKDTHWHIFIPSLATLEAMRRGDPLPPLEERYTYLRYPKIWEIGGIASIAERTIIRFIENQPKKLAGDVLRILRDVFNFEYMPQILEPIAELAMNRERFTDRPIENQSMKDMQAWARSDPRGSRLLRKFGENATRHFPEGTPEFLTSPAQIEALLRGYFNTWAHYGLLLEHKVFDDMPNMRADEYPILRRFYRQTPPRGNKYITEFYDALEAATQARRTMRAMVKSYRPEFASELAASPENLRYTQMTRANKRMQAISQQMRRVMDMPDTKELQAYALTKRDAAPREIARLRMSPDWSDVGALKRQLLDILLQERNAFAKQVIEEIERQ
jgi:hypothetical protein